MPPDSDLYRFRNMQKRLNGLIQFWSIQSKKRPALRAEVNIFCNFFTETYKLGSAISSLPLLAHNPQIPSKEVNLYANSTANICSVRWKISLICSQKREGIPEKLKELSILELYRRKEISSGKAAELLGMERFEFVRYASRLGIPFFDMSKEELEKT